MTEDFRHLRQVLLSLIIVAGHGTSVRADTTASDTCSVAVDLANVFFSNPIRKRGQKEFTVTRRSGSIYLQFCFRAVLTFPPSVIMSSGEI